MEKWFLKQPIKGEVESSHFYSILSRISFQKSILPRAYTYSDPVRKRRRGHFGVKVRMTRTRDLRRQRHKESFFSYEAAHSSSPWGRMKGATHASTIRIYIYLYKEKSSPSHRIGGGASFLPPDRRRFQDGWDASHSDITCTYCWRKIYSTPPPPAEFELVPFCLYSFELPFLRSFCFLNSISILVYSLTSRTLFSLSPLNFLLFFFCNYITFSIFVECFICSFFCAFLLSMGFSLQKTSKFPQAFELFLFKNTFFYDL